jgi:peptidoglycan hydrolase-like protein with peptidoglycan-binding domain
MSIIKKVLPLVPILIVTSIIFATPVAASFNRPLGIGIVNDEDVQALQLFLHDQGLYNGPITGSFLAQTKAAVKQFQRKNNILPVTGFFGTLSQQQANLILNQTSSQSPISGSTSLQNIPPPTDQSSTATPATPPAIVIPPTDQSSTATPATSPATATLQQQVNDLSTLSQSFSDRLDSMTTMVNNLLAEIQALSSQPVASPVVPAVPPTPTPPAPVSNSVPPSVPVIVPILPKLITPPSKSTISNTTIPLKISPPSSTLHTPVTPILTHPRLITAPVITSSSKITTQTMTKK